MSFRSLALVGIAGIALTAPGAWGQSQISPKPATTSYLGIMMQEVNSDRAKELKLPEEAGVEITVVEPNSPASMAGLMVGDVIVQFNGQKVEGIEQFSRMVRETPAGREVHLQIYRNGASQTLTAKIGSHAAPNLFGFQVPQPLLRDFPRGGIAAPLGIEAESVSGQLAEYFGARDGGVLVRSVMKNSPAEKAGIKAGDVITRVGNDRVAFPAEIAARVRGARGQSVAVTLMRDRRETTITVQLDADGSQRF